MDDGRWMMEENSLKVLRNQINIVSLSPKDNRNGYGFRQDTICSCIDSRIRKSFRSYNCSGSRRLKYYLRFDTVIDRP